MPQSDREQTPEQVWDAYYIAVRLLRHDIDIEHVRGQLDLAPGDLACRRISPRGEGAYMALCRPAGPALRIGRQRWGGATRNGVRGDQRRGGHSSETGGHWRGRSVWTGAPDAR